MRSSDWSSDVCSSDLDEWRALAPKRTGAVAARERESSVTTPFGPGRAGTVLSRGPGDPEIAGSGKGGHCGGQTVGTGGGTEDRAMRSEEPTSELQSLMRITYAVFCLTNKHIFSSRPHD